MQAERDAGGSIIAHWKPEQIKKYFNPNFTKTNPAENRRFGPKILPSAKKGKRIIGRSKTKGRGND